MPKNRLELKIGNQLVLTPQLQQAIRLLQMSSAELSNYIQEQLLSNPLLEEKNATSTSTAENKTDTENYEQSQNHTLSLEPNHEDSPDIPDYASEHNQYTDNPTTADTPHEAVDSHQELVFQEGFSNFSGSSSSSTGSGFSADSSEKVSLIELLADNKKDIRTVIMEQFQLMSGDSMERMIATNLIDMMDDAGWIIEDIETIALKIACPLDKVEHVLACLQQCEPSGVFARSLKECLTLQLQNLGCFDQTFAVLLDNLEDIAGGNVKRLERKTKKNVDEIREYVATIRKLHPKPATLYTRDVADVVVPDIIVFRDSRNRWQVNLNEHNLPNVNVRREFYRRVRRQVSSSEDKNFISESYQNASWLVKSIAQRNLTLLRVAQHIVQHQQLFFDRGINAIKPMILKEIAQRTNLHESTISRITTNKFIATPWGTFELKYFFNVSLSGVDGAAGHATNSVKHVIKKMVEQEQPPLILSDDKLVQNLAQQGIHIARRTVTKYREALNIPSSIIRRQQKNQTI